MAIVDMKKMTLVGLHDDKHRILTRLMEIGAVDITDVDIDEESKKIFKSEINKDNLTELNDKIRKLTIAISVLNPYDKRKKPMFKVRKEINKHDYLSVILKRHEVLAMAGKVGEIRDELIAVKSRINKSINSIVSLKSWAALSIPLEIETTKNTLLHKGMIPAAADIDAIKKRVEEENLACEIEVAGSDNDQTYIVVYVHADDAQTSFSILKRNGFATVSFPGLSGNVNGNIVKTEKDIEKENTRVGTIEKEFGDLAVHLDEIEMVFDYYSIRKDLLLVEGEIASGKRVFFLEGWIPAKIAENFCKEMSNKWVVEILVREPFENEEFPVLVENGFIADSVQDITEMYSLPAYDSVDPNPIMSPFFLLFFGLMLSDAGYGLVMAAVCGFLYFFVKLEDTMKRFMKMMMLCGVATIFWGALFGSWFGNLIPILQGDPNKDISLWFAPVSDPEYLLMWSLLFGIIHIFTGFAMKAANLFKQKKYLAVLFDVVFWYIFFTGAVFLVMPYVPGIPDSLSVALYPYGSYLMPAGALLLFLTQGRKSKTIGGKIVGGLTSIYDLINFMSDVLSYSRLLALGLATSVIASIVNQMGSMNGFNFMGIIVFILVFAAGHTLNFMLNALGAYVHSSRLQYIEYFSKFYEGGGKPFKPFRRNTKYIRIKD